MKKPAKGKIFSSSLFLLVCVLFQALTSCESFDLNREKPSTNLDIGEEIEVASVLIPATGGTVLVNSPGNMVDGLEIMVPPDSYQSSLTFTVSTAPILNHDLGEYFNPLTPLIQIKNSGGYATDIMEITIPVDIPEGEIPLGFYYDEITGTLEGIPTKDITENSITLITRHFMPASELSSSNKDMKAGGIEIDATSNLIISSISESVLQQTPVISTGFTVGQDDWEFTNYGSYIAPSGHCAGQNFAALWYYYEKKLKGENSLFGKYSPVPSLWFDNSIGYRFCSVIQEDIQWDGIVKSFCSKYIDKNQELDKLKLFTIAGVMLTTGEPQAIGIYRLTGGNYADGTPKYGGHSVICTRVAINEGKLYISDPNHPGNEQLIEFGNDKFTPYLAKENGNAVSNQYPFITLNSKTSLIEWNQIGKRFKEMEDSTIGNNAPNKFPGYTIWVKGAEDQILSDVYTSDSDTLRCIVECPEAELKWIEDEKFLIPYKMYNGTGTQIDTYEGRGQAYTLLKPGLNRIGFYISAARDGIKDSNNNYIRHFLDFHWVDVYYTKLRIEPNPIAGEPDKEVTIAALTDGSAPSNAKYIWKFGDGSDDEIVENDSLVEHTFEKEGDYVVSVELYDNSNNKLIGIATAEANIQEGILSWLQGFTEITVDFNADLICKDDINIIGSLSVDNVPAWGITKQCPLTWSGTSFSTNFDFEWETLDGEQIHSTGVISGEMSPNGLVMKSLSAQETSRHAVSGDVFNETITLNNVPYMADYQYNDFSPRFGAEGKTTSQYISSFHIKWDLVNSEGTEFTAESSSANYTDDSYETYLYVTFSEEK